MFLILGVVAIIYGVFMVINKKNLAIPSIIFILVGIVMTLVCITNIATEQRKIKIPEEVLEKISKTDWSDEQLLLQHGFEYYNEAYNYSFSSDKAESDLCNISVSKKANMDAHMSEHKDVYYKAKEKGIGLLDLRRLIYKDITVVRRYIIYNDGMQIVVTEDNLEKGIYLFEDFILNTY